MAVGQKTLHSAERVIAHCSGWLVSWDSSFLQVQTLHFRGCFYFTTSWYYQFCKHKYIYCYQPVKVTVICKQLLRTMTFWKNKLADYSRHWHYQLRPHLELVNCEMKIALFVYCSASLRAPEIQIISSINVVDDFIPL